MAGYFVFNFFSFFVVVSFLTNSLVSIALHFVTNLSYILLNNIIIYTLVSLLKSAVAVTSLSTSSLSTLAFKLVKLTFFMEFLMYQQILPFIHQILLHI